jgi:hypothetical protein
LRVGAATDRRGLRHRLRHGLRHGLRDRLGRRGRGGHRLQVQRRGTAVAAEGADPQVKPPVQRRRRHGQARLQAAGAVIVEIPLRVRAMGQKRGVALGLHLQDDVIALHPGQEEARLRRARRGAAAHDAGAAADRVVLPIAVSV